MTGESNWLPIAWMLIGGMGVIALAIGSQLAWRHFRAEQRQVVCPRQQIVVEALVVTDDRTGQVTGVQRCSGLRNPDDVTCAKSCVIPS